MLSGTAKQNGQHCQVDAQLPAATQTPPIAQSTLANTPTTAVSPPPLTDKNIDSLSSTTDVPEGLSVSLDIEAPDLDLSALLGDLVTLEPGSNLAGTATVVNNTPVVDLTGKGGEINAGKFFLDPFHTQLSNEKDTHSFDAHFSPSTGRVITTSERPLTAANIASLQAAAAAFYNANPHIPVQPLVIIVVDKSTWNQLQAALLELNTAQQQPTKEKKNDDSRKTMGEQLSRNEALKNSNIDSKSNRKETNNNESTHFASLEREMINRILKEMIKTGEEMAARRKDDIKQENLEKQKETDILKHDNLNRDILQTDIKKHAK